MNLKTIFATCCIAGIASAVAAQETDIQFTNYLGKIPTTQGVLPLAADADGRLFYATIAAANSAVRVIEDPEAAIGAAQDVGTTIAVYPQYPNQRGLQGLAVNDAGSLFVSGDVGTVVPTVWKFNPVVSGEGVTYVEETTFAANVHASAPGRRSGVAIINEAGAGLIAANGFYNIHFFDFAGNKVGDVLNNGQHNYMREMVYNPIDNIIYPLRNSGTLRLIMYYWENVNTSTGAADFVEEELISVGANNGGSGSAAQNGYFYEEQNQLITADQTVTISGVARPKHVRVWNSEDNGTSLSLAYTVSSKDEGTTFTDLGDVVVLNNRMYVSSPAERAIYVYGGVPANVGRWEEYE